MPSFLPALPFLPKEGQIPKKEVPTAQLMDGMLKVKRQRPGKADRLIPETLRGLPGIHVWISQVDASLTADGLDRERLWLEVQQRLAQAGLPVPNELSWQQTPLFPCLGVLIHADRAQVSPPFYVFSVEVFFVQKITLAGSPSANAMRMSWCREAIGDARGAALGFDWSVLYKTVGSMVDQFLQESLGVPVPEAPARVCN
jgi:hypothetical protein